MESTKDKLVFTLKNLTSLPNRRNRHNTNRSQFYYETFDPLEILSSVFIAFKILFQDICKKDVDWDAPLDGDVLERWKSLLQDVKDISSFSIYRRYSSGLKCLETSSFQLNGFGGASDKAFDAVVYFRVRSEN